MQYLPFIAFLLVLAVLVAIAGRARRKQAAVLAELADRIEVGTDVMTTSGLHGTVVARNDDGTVVLSIAPGVEVRWELAALRELSSLPARFGAAPVSVRKQSGTPAADDPDTGGEAHQHP